MSVTSRYFRKILYGDCCARSGKTSVPRTLRFHHTGYAAGFSLVEVLVALFVLSIGLLGLAALQTTGMRFNHQSYTRTQAAFQVYDIVDRMRVNKVGTSGNAHANYDNVALSDTGTNNDCVANACNSAALALDDIYTWKTVTARFLPEGQTAICRGTFNTTFTSCTVSASGSIYHIVVRWRENDITTTFEAQSEL
jgi:type IV pilus assembly protein PilV